MDGIERNELREGFFLLLFMQSMQMVLQSPYFTIPPMPLSHYAIYATYASTQSPESYPDSCLSGLALLASSGLRYATYATYVHYPQYYVKSSLLSANRSNF